MNNIRRVALYAPALILTLLCISGCQLEYLMTFESDTNYIQPGEAVTLNWSFETTEDVGLVNIEITPDLGEVNPIGSQTVNPAESTQYTMNASYTDSNGNTLQDARSVNTTVANIKANNCQEHEVACVQNYNLNTNTANGRKSIAVVPINFSDTNWNPTESKITNTMSQINEFLTQSSRGRLSFETIDVRSILEVPVQQSCKNREQARKHVEGENKYDIRVYSYPSGT